MPRKTYEQQPLTEQERADLLAAHERYQQTNAVWIRWLDGSIAGTSAEREVARREALRAIQTEIAVLNRIKAARAHSRRRPHEPREPHDPHEPEG